MRLDSFEVIVYYLRLQSVPEVLSVFIGEYLIPIPPVDRLWSKTAKKKSTRNQFSAPYYGGLLTAER